MAKRARIMRESRAPGHNDLRSRGVPDPDRAIVRTRRRSNASGGRSNAPATPREVALSPRAYKRRVEKVYQAMLDAQAAVKRARECGDEDARAQFAIVARERRAAWLTISGEMPEGRVIDVNLGSETNPVRAV